MEDDFYAILAAAKMKEPWQCDESKLATDSIDEGAYGGLVWSRKRLIRHFEMHGSTKEQRERRWS